MAEVLAGAGDAMAIIQVKFIVIPFQGVMTKVIRGVRIDGDPRAIAAAVIAETCVVK